MAESTMQVIEVEGAVYTSARAGYYYRKRTGEEKWTRVPKTEWDEAFEQNMQNKNDAADAQEWENEAEQERKAREEKQAESDKQAEKAVNGTKTKKASKPRRSKDIAFEGKGFAGGITLTAKQVAFIKAMPQDDFYEKGLDSALWIDVFCDTVAGQFSPMAVGAMVSTLREKHLIHVVSDRVNGRKCKWMAFTETGKEVAKQLGLN